MNWYQNKVDKEIERVDSMVSIPKGLKGRSVIFREDDVGGRARLTVKDRASTASARTLNKDEVMKVRRLGG